MIDIKVKLRFDFLQFIPIIVVLVNKFLLNSCTIEIYQTPKPFFKLGYIQKTHIPVSATLIAKIQKSEQKCSLSLRNQIQIIFFQNFFTDEVV